MVSKQSPTINLLFISGDSSIGKRDTIDDTSQFRDVLNSLSLYDEIGKIHVICKSKFNSNEPWYQGKIHVYPTKPSSVLYYILKAIARGFNIIKKHHIDVVVSQDVLQCGLPAFILKKLF